MEKGAGARSSTVQFPKTRNAISEFRKLLLCVKCNELPEEKFHLLGNVECDHKYCEKCITRGKPCIICKKEAPPRDSYVDLLTTDLVMEYRKFMGHLDMKNPDTISPSVKNTATEDSTPVVADEDDDSDAFMIPTSTSVTKAKKGSKPLTKPRKNITLSPIPVTPEQPKPVTGRRKSRKGKTGKKSQPSAVSTPIPSAPSGQECNLRSAELELIDDFSIGNVTMPSPLTVNNILPPVLSPHTEATEKEKILRAYDNVCGEDDSLMSTPPVLTQHNKKKDKNESPVPDKRITKNTKTLTRQGKRTASSTECAADIENKDGDVITFQTPKRLKRNASSTATSSEASFDSMGTPNKRNAKGETKLHIAAKKGEIDKVRELLESGADVNAQDHAKWTPLHEAILGKATNKLDIVKVLCEAGCNVNLSGLENETPLHEAARSGLDDIVSLLLLHGASVNIRNSAGKLPSEVATTDSIRELIEEGNQHSGDTSLSQVLDDSTVIANQFLSAVMYISDKEKAAKVTKDVQEILKCQVSPVIRDNVTHVFLPVPTPYIHANGPVPLSQDYLFAVLDGAWIINDTWLDDAIRQQTCISPRGYEIIGCESGETHTITASVVPKRARVWKQVKKDDLFDGFVFFLYKTCGFGDWTKRDIAKIIAAGGGKLLNREPKPESIDPLENPYRPFAKTGHPLFFTSHIILFDDINPPSAKLTMEHVKTLNVRWLIESVGNFEIMDPENYY